MSKVSKTITKRDMIDLIHKKLALKFSKSHIGNVVSFFIDQFMIELQEKRIINMANFCSFRIERTKPRKYHDYIKNRFSISKGRPQLKIKISYSLSKKIINHIDIVKTFLGEK